MKRKIVFIPVIVLVVVLIISSFGYAVARPVVPWHPLPPRESIARAVAFIQANPSIPEVLVVWEDGYRGFIFVYPQRDIKIISPKTGVTVPRGKELLGVTWEYQGEENQSFIVFRLLKIKEIGFTQERTWMIGSDIKRGTLGVDATNLLPGKYRLEVVSPTSVHSRVTYWGSWGPERGFAFFERLYDIPQADTITFYISE